MTCTAIGKFCKQHGVVLGFLAMTIKTPPHIYHLRILIYCFLAEVAMAILAVKAGGNVRTMDKMHKIRNLRDRHPIYGQSCPYSHKIVLKLSPAQSFSVISLSRMLTICSSERLEVMDRSHIICIPLYTVSIACRENVYLFGARAYPDRYGSFRLHARPGVIQIDCAVLVSGPRQLDKLRERATINIEIYRISTGNSVPAQPERSGW